MSEPITTIHTKATGPDAPIVIRGLAFSKSAKGWIVKCKKGAVRPSPSQILDALLDEIQRLRAKITAMSARAKAH